MPSFYSIIWFSWNAKIVNRKTKKYYLLFPKIEHIEINFIDCKKPAQNVICIVLQGLNLQILHSEIAPLKMACLDILQTWMQ